MITPEQLSKLEKNQVVELYEKLNIDLTAEIINMLQKDEILTLSKSQLKKKIKKDEDEMFFIALGILQGIESKKTNAMKNVFNEVLDRSLEDYVKSSDIFNNSKTVHELIKKSSKLIDNALMEASGELKEENKKIAEANKNIYSKVLKDLYQNVSSGKYTYNEAMHKAINELTEKGIVLKSKDGKQIRLETAIRQNLFTHLHYSANELAEQVGKEIGADGVWIGPTSRCRPGHIPINGVKMSLKEFKDYAYLTEEYNCMHQVNYIIMDLFEPPYSKKELKDINDHVEENYKKIQKANYYERQIRKKKEEVAILKKADNTKSITQELLKRKEQELINAKNKYRGYCYANNLKYDEKRIWKAGYDSDFPIKNTHIDLTLKEKYAVNQYASFGSYIYNEKLRKGYKLTTTEKSIIDNLDKALIKMPIYKGTVIRDIEIPKHEMNSFLDDYKIGSIKTEKAFTSTSKKSVYNDKANVRMKIISKTGRNMIKYNDAEKEILFERNTKFKIINVDIDDSFNVKIELEEVK